MGIRCLSQSSFRPAHLSRSWPSLKITAGAPIIKALSLKPEEVHPHIVSVKRTSRTYMSIKCILRHIWRSEVERTVTGQIHQAARLRIIVRQPSAN